MPITIKYQHLYMISNNSKYKDMDIMNLAFFPLPYNFRYQRQRIDSIIMIYLYRGLSTSYKHVLIAWCNHVRNSWYWWIFRNAPFQINNRVNSSLCTMTTVILKSFFCYFVHCKSNPKFSSLSIENIICLNYLKGYKI